MWREANQGPQEGEMNLSSGRDSKKVIKSHRKSRPLFPCQIHSSFSTDPCLCFRPHWDMWQLRIYTSCSSNHLRRLTGWHGICFKFSGQARLVVRSYLSWLSLCSALCLGEWSHMICVQLSGATLRVTTVLRGGQARAWAGQTFGRVFTPSILCAFKARDRVSLVFLSLALCMLFYIHLISIDTFLLNK